MIEDPKLSLSDKLSIVGKTVKKWFTKEDSEEVNRLRGRIYYYKYEDIYVCTSSDWESIGESIVEDISKLYEKGKLTKSTAKELLGEMDLELEDIL
jgi:hypothetical protein